MSIARASVPVQSAFSGRPRKVRTVRVIEAERSAQRSPLDDLRDQLVTAVNHEVRTPLAVIMGHLELIAEHDAAFAEGVAWSLEAIDRAARHLAEVVDAISEIADDAVAPPPRSLPRVPRRLRSSL